MSPPVRLLRTSEVAVRAHERPFAGVFPHVIRYHVFVTVKGESKLNLELGNRGAEKHADIFRVDRKLQNSPGFVAAEVAEIDSFAVRSLCDNVEWF